MKACVEVFAKFLSDTKYNIKLRINEICVRNHRNLNLLLKCETAFFKNCSVIVELLS